jgi:hypothetical protein
MAKELAIPLDESKMHNAIYDLELTIRLDGVNQSGRNLKMTTLSDIQPYKTLPFEG